MQSITWIEISTSGGECLVESLVESFVERFVEMEKLIVEYSSRMRCVEESSAKEYPRMAVYGTEFFDRG